MTNAEHIFAWARNDQVLCHQMRAARAYPEGRNFSTSRAMGLFKVYADSLRDMKQCGGDVSEYTARDVLKAAIFMLDWDGEE